MAPRTPMDVAATGLERAGSALGAIYEALRQVLPITEQHGERALLLGERAVVALEKIASAAERRAGAPDAE